VLLVYLSLHEEMSLLAFMNELVKIVVSYVLDNSCSSIGVGAALAIQAVVFVVVIIVVVVVVVVVKRRRSRTSRFYTSLLFI